ncbi:uncharacterized protein FOMMEDRAFT_139189 [Fomitiporia mediterranea MF3/22]|uniref:uncharacterized protein n=1 Tax=Fomitiporia mediterranea (strain MF3/22) TaxID=694068 RepID=UPI0004408DA9|nr:uncharacterized protein FOMMEDRAFT_139189 [Fomitiporia mediterranea MF3/22]EJD05860.1 hypothetical protein FOMMEDRAFT_139189 [Fomitiporia mediterranea MF3/22]
MILSSGIKLNLTPVKSTDIPPEDQLIQAARELAEATTKWKHTKDYAKGVVKGYSAPKQADDEEPWFCRVSEHAPEEISFDEFWFALGTNKPEHERKFVHNIDNVVQLKKLSDEATIWNLHYKFAPPISNRSFTVLQVIHLDTSAPKRTGIVVSIPIDVSGDEEMSKAELKGARGRYVSVERLLELENGKTEWRMATSSTPGGSIPSFIAQASVPGQVANDVPLFFKWYNSDKEYFKKGIQKDEPAQNAAPTEPTASS